MFRPDWDLSTPGLREAWDAGDYSKFHGWDRRSPRVEADIVRRTGAGRVTAIAVSTPVCEMLGIEQPIVKAPMAAIPRLAAAVSNAGALGMVTLTCPRGLPAPADGRGRDRPAVVPQPVRRRVARLSAPRAPQLNGQGVVSRGLPPDDQRPGIGDVIAHFASGESIVRYEPAPPMAGTAGEIEALSMWAGQGVALATERQSAADIVTELTSRL